MNPFRDEDGRQERIRMSFLTKKQKKIFKLYMSGMGRRQIAQKVGTSPSNILTTVKKSVDKICQHYYNLDIYRLLVRRGGLTNTEKMILKLWKVYMKPNKEMAKKLRIKTSTVEWHKQNIRGKINVREFDKARDNYSVFNDNPKYDTPDISRFLLKKATEKGKACKKT
jgi:DNA-binding CsgD family transcriptional regulator